MRLLHNEVDLIIAILNQAGQYLDHGLNLEHS